MINVTYFDEWCAKVWHMGIMHYEYSHREFHSKFTETFSTLYDETRQAGRFIFYTGHRIEKGVFVSLNK